MSKNKFSNSVDECVKAIEEVKVQEGHGYAHPSNFAITKPEIETLYGEGFILYSWGANPVQFVNKEHSHKRGVHMFLRRHAYGDFPEETPILYLLAFDSIGPDIKREKLYQALRERNVDIIPGGSAWWQSTYSKSLEEAIQLYRELDALMPGMLVKSSKQSKPQHAH